VVSVTAGERQIPFAKYHGLGNDYLVIVERDLPSDPLPELARRICDRSCGVGSDGILLKRVDPDTGAFSVRIVNPDGSEAEKSGNGLRIFARSLWDSGEVGAEPFRVMTRGGEVFCHVQDAGRTVRVEMGRVTFDSEAIPVSGPRREVLCETFEIDGEHLEYSAASIGNPHCVLFRDPLLVEDLLRLGPLIEREPRFPNRTNVQFARVLDRKTIQLEIWERGAGHTLASGSSSCAAAAVAHRLGYCDAELDVVMPGGVLAVEIDRDYQITQFGPVVRVAEGLIDAEALEDLDHARS
jgi:diaminopimelate epimerase